MLPLLKLVSMMMDLILKVQEGFYLEKNQS